MAIQGYDIDKRTPAGESVVEIPLHVLKEAVSALGWPLTDYLRYEFAVYRHTVAAGEDVRILDVTDRPDPGLPNQDFWLFDDTSIVRMDYDGQGRQLGRELLEDTNPAPYVQWQRIALAHALPFAEYVTLLE